MAATIRKHGSPDYGYWIIECKDPKCLDLNGRSWQQAHSRRTVEGHTIAVRNMEEHNRARHPKPTK